MSVPLSFVQCEEPKNCSFFTDDGMFYCFISKKCKKVKHSFSKSDIFQGAILARSVQTCKQMRGPASEEESCWQGMKREDRRHFIFNPFRKANLIIYTLWILASGSLPEIQNITLIRVHMTSLTNIKPPRSYTYSSGTQTAWRRYLVCLQAALAQPNILHPAFSVCIRPGCWSSGALMLFATLLMQAWFYSVINFTT